MRKTTLGVALLAVACASTSVPSATPAPAVGADSTRANLVRADARAAYDRRSFGECVQLFAAAEKLASGSRTDAYDAACCFALDAKSDAAFEWLHVALERGYRDTNHLTRDRDLAILHTDARWPGLVTKATSARDAHLRTLNQELFTLFEEDQQDRATADPSKDWSAISQRDGARRARVTEILAAGGAKVGGLERSRADEQRKTPALWHAVPQATR